MCTVHAGHISLHIKLTMPLLDLAGQIALSLHLLEPAHDAILGISSVVEAGHLQRGGGHQLPRHHQRRAGPGLIWVGRYVKGQPGAEL